MILAQVTGSIVSTIKNDCYIGKKVMLVRPVDASGVFSGATQVAVDTVGAGKGDTVLVASEGKAASEILGFDKRIPMRSVIIAIVDNVSVDENI